MKKQYKEAEDSFLEAVKYVPQDTDLWSFFALMQFLQGGMSVDRKSKRCKEDKELFAREVKKTIDKSRD